MNKNYWETRLSDEIYTKNTKLMQRELKKLYKSAANTIDYELTDLYNKMLADGEISANAMFRENRYKKLQDEINNQIINIGINEEKLVKDRLINSFKEIYQMTMKGLGFEKSWTVMNDRMAEAIVTANFKGAKFSNRIWSNKDELRDKIEKVVIDNVIAGRNKDIGVRDIKERFSVGFSDADRIVRTETMRVLNEGQRQTYEDIGYTHYEFLAELDNRTSDECEDLDGDIFEFANAEVGTNFPPMHPNCRSTVIPIVDMDRYK